MGVQDYWWYRVRAELLRVVMEPYVGSPTWVLDVGSADGPSVGWLTGHGRKVDLDVDPRGLPENSVCGSALALPFADATFDVVAAFDVIEHCKPEAVALAELARVLKPGGRLLVSVPAYQWAWSDFDVANGHHRRYTRPRIRRSVTDAGLEIERATYAFVGVFPFFAAERLVRRTRRALRKAAGHPEGPADIAAVPDVAPAMDKLLSACSRVDGRWLKRRNLAFGSSVFVAATKPRRPA